jgi:hypothetical protein
VTVLVTQILPPPSEGAIDPLAYRHISLRSTGSGLSPGSLSVWELHALAAYRGDDLPERDPVFRSGTLQQIVSSPPGELPTGGMTAAALTLVPDGLRIQKTGLAPQRSVLFAHDTTVGGPVSVEVSVKDVSYQRGSSWFYDHEDFCGAGLGLIDHRASAGAYLLLMETESGEKWVRLLAPESPGTTESERELWAAYFDWSVPFTATLLFSVAEPRTFQILLRNSEEEVSHELTPNEVSDLLSRFRLQSRVGIVPIGNRPTVTGWVGPISGTAELTVDSLTVFSGGTSVVSEGYPRELGVIAAPPAGMELSYRNQSGWDLSGGARTTGDAVLLPAESSAVLTDTDVLVGDRGILFLLEVLEGPVPAFWSGTYVRTHTDVESVGLELAVVLGGVSFRVGEGEGPDAFGPPMPHDFSSLSPVFVGTVGADAFLSSTSEWVLVESYPEVSMGDSPVGVSVGTANSYGAKTSVLRRLLVFSNLRCCEPGISSSPTDQGWEFAGDGSVSRVDGLFEITGTGYLYRDDAPLPEYGAVLSVRGRVASWSDALGRSNPRGIFVGPLISAPITDLRAAEVFGYVAQDGRRFLVLGHMGMVPRDRYISESRFAVQMDFGEWWDLIFIVRPGKHIQLYTSSAGDPDIEVSWGEYPTRTSEAGTPALSVGISNGLMYVRHVRAGVSSGMEVEIRRSSSSSTLGPVGNAGLLSLAISAEEV